MIGQTVSHYRITEKLGGGGMGVVYKAEDTKLKRTVALKFLPPDLIGDQDAKERFVHEAQAASALDHNNICNIHEIGETDDGQIFIAMACYDGETLKSRIAKGKSRPERSRGMRIEEATDLAIQIAQGLAEAHQHGIIHRDVKPANILITKSGVAKVVDFGLAKLTGRTKVTKTGSTLGTVAYMSPEQLQGSDVDARGDVFSFGVMLYEMLTGQLPFRGDHEAALMYSITNQEPEPLQSHLPEASSELIHIVNRALEKSPDDRYKTMDDLLIDLRRFRKETSKVSMPTYGDASHSHRLLRRSGVRWALGALVLVAIITGVILMLRPSIGINPDMKLRTLNVPFSAVRYASLSDDGNWLVFPAEDKQFKYDVYMMSVAGQGEPRRITHDSAEYMNSAILSPDGGTILYHRTGSERRDEIVAVPTLGGAGRVVVEGAFGGRALRDGKHIAYFVRRPLSESKLTHQLWSMTLDGADRKLLIADTLTNQRGPRFAHAFSPDEKQVAWVRNFPEAYSEIIIKDLSTGEEKQLTFDKRIADDPKWTFNNYIVYASDRGGNTNLWIVPAKGGEPVQLTRGGGPDVCVGISRDGRRLVYSEMPFSGQIKHARLDDGAVQQLTTDESWRGYPSISTSGQIIVFSQSASEDLSRSTTDIYVMDRREGSTRILTHTEEFKDLPFLSPDEKWITYGSRKRTEPVESTRVFVLELANPAPKLVGFGLWAWWFNNKDFTISTGTRTYVAHLDLDGYEKTSQDSIQIYPVLEGKSVVLVDRHKGREGLWLARSKSDPTEPTKGARLLLKSLAPTFRIAQKSNELFYVRHRGTSELHRISLLDGKDRTVPYKFQGHVYGFDVTPDGKEIVYREVFQKVKYTVIDDPFK